MISLILLLVSQMLLLPAIDFVFAQSTNQKLWIEYDDNLISVSANEADLKKVLLKIAEKANINVWFPASLEKKVTFREDEITLRKALRRLLNGLNFAITYSGTSKNNSTVTGVYVFNKSKNVNVNYRRINDQINALERQILLYKTKLSEVGENSKRGKIYLTRIINIENNIKSLERQLN